MRTHFYRLNARTKIASLAFMARKRAIQQAEFPYNISARCINKEWFNIPMQVVWDIFCEELSKTHEKHDLLIHSFVLMSNHYHLIASTPKANISQCMHQFMSRTSRRLTLEGNRINETFAGRHFKCILQDTNYYLNAYKYNYRNPVAAGLCQKVEEYPFSTLVSLLNKSKPPLPLVEDTTFTSDPIGTLKWLNTAPDPNKLKGLQIALRHQFFKSSEETKGGKYFISKHELI